MSVCQPPPPRPFFLVGNISIKTNDSHCFGRLNLVARSYCSMVPNATVRNATVGVGNTLVGQWASVDRLTDPPSPAAPREAISCVDTISKSCKTVKGAKNSWVLGLFNFAECRADCCVSIWHLFIFSHRQASGLDVRLFIFLSVPMLFCRFSSFFAPVDEKNIQPHTYVVPLAGRRWLCVCVLALLVEVVNWVGCIGGTTQTVWWSRL